MVRGDWRRARTGPSARLRDRPCRRWPPSSGSSNASSSVRPRASSAHASSRSSCSGGSSGRWRPSGCPRGSHARAQPVRRPPQSGRPRRVRRHDRLARVGARRRRASSSPEAATRSLTGRGSTCWPIRPSSAPISASSPGSPTRSPVGDGRDLDLGRRSSARRTAIGDAAGLDEGRGRPPTRWSSRSRDPARRRRASDPAATADELVSSSTARA